jgi:hypothetical protein
MWLRFNGHQGVDQRVYETIGLKVPPFLFNHRLVCHDLLRLYYKKKRGDRIIFRAITQQMKITKAQTQLLDLSLPPCYHFIWFCRHPFPVLAFSPFPTVCQ